MATPAPRPGPTQQPDALDARLRRRGRPVVRHRVGVVAPPQRVDDHVAAALAGGPGGELLLGLHARGGPERCQQLWDERQHTGRGLGLGAALDDLAVDDDAGDLDADRLCLEVDLGPAQPVATAAFYTPCLPKHRATPKRPSFDGGPVLHSLACLTRRFQRGRRGSNPRPTDSVLSVLDSNGRCRLFPSGIRVLRASAFLTRPGLSG